MQIRIVFAWTVLLAAFPVHWASAGPFTTLYQFAPGSNGDNPWAGVGGGASTLFGTTQNDGSMGHGTIFKMNADGSGYQVLHNFSGVADGQGYHSSIVYGGSVLYGITGEGGSVAGSGGILFQMNTDGSGFQVLHNFTGAIGDGAYSQAGLTLSGSALYGISGRTSVTPGAIFKMVPGGAFQSLHSFSQIANADMTPTGFERLLVVGSTIYGTSESGGSNGAGAVFSINTDGSNFQLLHSFDGARPSLLAAWYSAARRCTA